MWTGSRVHSSTLGVVYVQSGKRNHRIPCVKYKDISIWKAWTLGLYAHASSDIIAENVRIADVKVGIYLSKGNKKRGASGKHKFQDHKITIKDALVIGRSAGNGNCSEAKVPG